MTKSIKSMQRVRRNTLASAAALAFVAAAPAMAETMDNGFYRFGQYDGSADQTLALSNYALWITTPQLNTGYLLAMQQAVSYQAQLSGPAATGTPVVQTGNSITALATANQAASSIALALLTQGTQGVEGTEGAAIMTGQLRLGAASQAVVSGGVVSTSLSGMPVADQVISANTLSASATLNQSASTIEGVLPAGYASSRPGMVSTGSGIGGFGVSSSGATIESGSTASVGITTAQVSVDAGQRAGSHAALLGSDVALAATGPADGQGPNQLSAQLSITGNALSAQYTGNRASSRFDALAGSAPFAGSVVVSNLQSNAESAGLSEFNESGTGRTADVASTRVSANLGGGGAGMRSELTGALAVTGNDILASSTGNDAGNSIVLAGGSEIRGNQSPRMNMASTIGATGGSMIEADLALASVQANRDTGFVSAVSDSGVSARLDQLAAGGSVALDRNSIGGRATGNAASNRIQADASLLSAGAAASNVQSNASTEVAATNLGSRIDSSIGVAGIDAGGSVSLSANQLSASASGNAASTQVALSATHLGTGGMPAFAVAIGGQGGLAFAGADASAVNVQAGRDGDVWAQVANGGVGASFADQLSDGAAVGLKGASVTLKDNLLRSQAIGNDAATGVTLAATTASTSAALASMQTSSNRVGSSMNGMAVTADAGNLQASSVTLEGNTLAAAAIANRADNRLQASLGILQPDATGIGGGNSGPNIAMADMVSAAAGFTVVNAQRNDGWVDSSNVSDGAMVQASVGPTSFGGSAGMYSGPGVHDSTVAVKDNAIAAASTGNQAANTLSLQADATAGTGLNGALAAVNSVQAGWTDGPSDAVAGGLGGQLVGVRVAGQLTSSIFAVTGNTVSATNLGNSVANQLQASGTSLASSGPMLRDLRGDVSFATVSNDFSLVNQQSSHGGGRSARTVNAVVGIEDSGPQAWGAAFDNTFTVSGNRNLAEARNNDAANGISLAGYSVLGAGAGLVNGQDSGSAVSASATGQLGVRLTGMGVWGSTVALTDNVTRALAVANSADNSIAAQATTLQAGGFGMGLPSGGGAGVASGADFAVGNIQSHNGPVDAQASSAARLDLGWNGAVSSPASVTGNLVTGIAQANSANNTLALAATTVNGVSGAVTSMQSAAGDVSARAGTAGEGGASFAVGAGGLYWTQTDVSNNTLGASAGQNEAFNQHSVTASSIFGGNNASAFVNGPSLASGGVDFTVSSQQSGAGNIDATALPGGIGVFADQGQDNGLTVTGNQVSARANVNTASNALTLAASAALGASGLVSNLQSTGIGAVTASVGSSIVNTTVGAMAYSLNGTAVAVTGNSLAAQAVGNNGANVLNASGAMAATAGPATQSFAVLNSQANAASMNAAVRNATIGVMPGGYEAAVVMNSASAAVRDNSVLASGYGNTASNAIALGMPQAASGSATASLASSQTNTAPIVATVSSVKVGLVGVAARGSSGVISGNAIAAQAIGNAVVNTISVK